MRAIQNLCGTNLPEKHKNSMPYIKQYSPLEKKELLQLSYKRRFKTEIPRWDDTMELLKNELTKRIPEKCSVLDAGCGHGNYIIDELREKFSSAVGIDVSPEVMEKNICLDKTIIGNLESLPLENNSFDLVISLWVFEHIQNPTQVFQEIARVLKLNGYFAFTTPNKKSFLIKLRRIINDSLAKYLVKKIYGREENDTFPVYYKINTQKDIQKLAQENGFICEFLKENEDPSYTSFNSFSYTISKYFSLLPFSFCKPHIIAILKKK
jgi:SAM-dependent methyltransferase